MLDTGKLKKFASKARADLIDQVSAKLDHVLSTDSAELREKEKALQELKKQISATSKEAVIERVAYTWFNRFCALRFMDVNRYSRMGIVSPVEGATQPEILAEAKQGHIDERYLEGKKTQRVFKLLNGTLSSKNPQTEAYRILIVAACNYYHRAMPYLFERIEDYTELLMPDDLLSDNSILADVRQAIGMDDCKDVEIIGWLYQYYISVKKDEVINRRSTVSIEEIPFATQLFTPDWIVRYMVENSLGRLWLLNNPSSNLKSKMEYYIEPEEAETDFLKITSPEEIKVCDPACGSGHMLTYAFDLLYAIYEEQGYDATEIPELILTKNLYGVEIDERAGSLAAFALSMKARDKNRRFLEKNIQPNICVLENTSFTDEELSSYRKELGQDLLSQPLLQTLGQFAEADNFGSLIEPAMENPLLALRELESKDFTSELFLHPIHQKVIKALTQADYLSQKYHVIIANPPYMGQNALNKRLKKFLQDEYKNAKNDVFAAFIIRSFSLIKDKGYMGFVTPFVWMFISSYKNFRETILDNSNITSLIQLEYNAFAPACIPVATFSLRKEYGSDLIGTYIKLSNFKGVDNQAPRTLEAINNASCSWRYDAYSSYFKKIPDSPIAYWLPKTMYNIFEKNGTIREYCSSIIKGIFTGDNNRFIRIWSEVSFDKFRAGEWKKYSKAGGYRKWYGLTIYALDWRNSGEELKNFSGSGLSSAKHFDKKHIVWSKLTSGDSSFRYDPDDIWFDDASPAIVEPEDPIGFLGLLNSSVSTMLFKTFNPTLNLQAGDVAKIPYPGASQIADSSLIINQITNIAKNDWDFHEVSWDFQSLPLLASDNLNQRMEDAYQELRASWKEMTDEMKRLEEKNNQIFIDAYGLQDELTADVPLEEITLTCNPYYRYGGKNTPEALEAKLLSDTMQEYIHYAVGCMFGRYSIDKPGLILANQADTIAEYKAQVPNSRFDADEDNVIPVLNENWFEDDIVERFQKFLRVTFGEQHYKENLEFIENAIGKNLRKYFTKDFYDYHVRRYKKRPIYWMFSSPKGTFNALIYMHRYRPDTASVVLNDYLRDFRTKLEAKKADCEQTQISTSASEAEKVRATKEIDKLKIMIDELNHWEKDVLHPLATQRIEIDLDDGVKVNYPKFGAALKPIKGLEANDAE